MKVDLHLHSFYSDGRLSPAEVVEKCKDLGLETISLTDHENVDGLPGALQAGQKLGIKVIPGVELDSSYQGEEHHILGYLIDHQNKGLKDVFIRRRQTRMPYIEQVINNLRALGFKVDLEEVIAQIKGSVHRSHIAWVVFHQNFQDNLSVLRKYEVDHSLKAFFQKFLLNGPRGEGLALQGTTEEMPKIEEAIELIKSVGGMAFWAHPFWENKDVSAARVKASYFQKIGLAGIEVCYPFHTQEQTRVLHQIVQDFLMYESAGSDFHGFDNSPKQIVNFQTFGIELNLSWVARAKDSH